VLNNIGVLVGGLPMWRWVWVACYLAVYLPTVKSKPFVSIQPERCSFYHFMDGRKRVVEIGFVFWNRFSIRYSLFV